MKDGRGLEAKTTPSETGSERAACVTDWKAAKRKKKIVKNCVTVGMPVKRRKRHENSKESPLFILNGTNSPQFVGRKAKTPSGFCEGTQEGVN